MNFSFGLPIGYQKEGYLCIPMIYMVKSTDWFKKKKKKKVLIG